MGERATQDVAVDCPFGLAYAFWLAGKRPQHVAPAGGRHLQDRVDRLEFAQFAGGEAIDAHHHLVARREIAPVKKPCRFQGPGVRPHIVVVGAVEGERPVGHDAVEQVPVDGNAIAEHGVGGILADDDRAPGCAFA